MKKLTKRIAGFVFSTLLAFTVGAGVYSAYQQDDVTTASAEAESTDITDGIYSYNWNHTGDYAEAGLYRFYISDDINVNWTNGVGSSCLNENAGAHLLDSIIIDGKSITQHRNEYKALIDSGETSPITWDGMPSEWKGKMQPNIAEDVKLKRAIYAPIFVWLTYHGGQKGSALDIYIPTSYISDVTSIEFTKDFKWSNSTQTFGLSDKVTFTKNSFGAAKKIGEIVAPNVRETTVTGVDGTYGETTDKFLSFYLSANDYSGDTVAASKERLSEINYYDYIEIDGQKLGTLMNKFQGQIFYNVWNRQNSFSTRWPGGIAKVDDAQEIKFLAGCQFPAQTDTNGVFEVKEETVFYRQADGTFATTPAGSTPEVPEVPVEKVVYETEVTSLNGAINAGDGSSFLSFVLSNNDYKGLNTIAVDKATLKEIQYYDYIEIDGVKLREYFEKEGQGEVFYNVWGRANTFSTRWPEAMNPLQPNNKFAEVQRITIYEGCQFPGYTKNTVYQVNETKTFVRMPGDQFADESKLIAASDVNVSKVSVAGDKNELYKFTISYKGWAFTYGGGPYDYNYSSYKASRQLIKLNGRDIEDINDNVDDSKYVYSTYPSNLKGKDGTPEKDPVNAAKELFANPVLLESTGDDTMIFYVHKDYVDSLCKDFGDQLVLTIESGYAQSGIALKETLTAVIYEIGYDMVLMNGDVEFSKLSVVAGSELIDLPTPEKANYNFAGWVDADGNAAPATMPKASLTLYASWAVKPYTVTVNYLDGTTKTVTFGVEVDAANNVLYTPADMEEVVKGMLPEATENEGYGYVEKYPYEFDLQDYTFTVTTVKLVFTITFTDAEGNDIGVKPITFTEKTIDTLVLPEVPPMEGYTAAWNKTVDRLKLEDVTLYAVYTEIKQAPTVTPEDSTDSDADADVDAEEKGGLSAITSMIPGCSGIVGGVAGGVVALGVAAVALLKKKEEDK